MSLSTNSALRRILDDVRDSAAAPPVLRVERTESPGQVLEVFRSRRVHVPPFATSLHFWAHALRALLERAGRPDAFDALAVNCLCKTVPGDEAAAAVDALAGRLEPAGRVERNAGYRVGHLMIEQDVLVSWVAEHEDEFVAVFWLHPGWLSEARTIPRE